MWLLRNAIVLLRAMTKSTCRRATVCTLGDSVRGDSYLFAHSGL